MELGFFIPVGTICATLGIWAIVLLVRMLLRNKKSEGLEERIKELSEALETTKTLAADRRLALDNKTKDIYELQFKTMELEKELDKQKDKYALLLNQKKSTEVRVGQISEQIAPFLHAWPWKTGGFRFIGSPIDGISFEDDCVVFVEIKTGKGRLSPTQLRIRKQIREGKVKWAEFRVDNEGMHIKEG